MRPTKLTPELLDAFRAVIADEWAALAFTEEELVWQANQRLPEADRISYRTYQRYKADILYLEEGGDDGVERPADADDTANAKLVQGMHETLKGALMAQKKALVRGVGEGQTNWRRYSWLLERKFPDFRLKPLNEALKKQQGQTDGEGVKRDDGKAESAEETQKRREAHDAKIEAEKAAARPKTVEEKWEGRYWLPWKPMHQHTRCHFELQKVRELEEELARDVAAGYVDPYAHLEYRPDTEKHDSGFYKYFGLGPDKLPLRAHLLRHADEPDMEDWEELWQEQDLKRRNIIRAEQGLPPEELPETKEDTEAPERHFSRKPGTIYGSSVMGI